MPLYPFPDGWYVIGESDDIRVGKLIEKIWMGEQIIVWRGTEGTVCVADALCPHPGSHLGPTAGGKIRNGNLVCPFHGFEYDVTGQCVATPTAPPPRSARLRRFETAEVNGFVFAYHGRTGDEPTWQIPDFSDAPSAGVGAGAGAEDFTISRLTAQLRYRWQIAPLSDLFVVYTRGANLDNAYDLDDPLAMPRDGFGELYRDAFTEPLIDLFVVKLRYRFGG